MSTESIQEQKIQVDELTELRQQAYKALMSIGAQIPAEKIILNDLTKDESFNLGLYAKCVVGWSYKGKDNYNVHGGYNERAGKCSCCTVYANDLSKYQIDIAFSPSFHNPIPTKEFLLTTLNFVNHYKGVHQ